MTSGCAGTLSIQENLFSNQYRSEKYSGRFFMKKKAIESRSDELIKEYLIKCKSRKQNVGMLSGGNIQKVIVAREFSTGPDIIIANQPTRGIDVGAAAFIRKRLLEFRGRRLRHPSDLRRPDRDLLLKRPSGGYVQRKICRLLYRRGARNGRRAWPAYAGHQV